MGATPRQQSGRGVVKGPLRRALRRSWVAITRVPVLGDRRGMRWTLNGRVMPGGPIVILTHRGRHTGRTRRTPVEATVEDEESGEVIVLPARGKQSDWYRNIVAGGLVEVRLRGKSFPAAWRRLSEDQKQVALERYVSAHPRFARSIIRGLARRHDLSGEPIPAVARALPMLAFELAEPEPRTSPRAE
jgi:deazaflavin-dependent oxidoreductase (nitroreductase family)